MHINSLDTAAILSDAELLAAVKGLAAHERHATAQPTYGAGLSPVNLLVTEWFRDLLPRID